MKKSTDNELSRTYSESEIKQRFTIGVAVGIMLTVCVMLLLLIAYHSSPRMTPKHEDSVYTASPARAVTPANPLADSCGKAIIQKYNNRHGIKTIEDK